MIAGVLLGVLFLQMKHLLPYLVFAAVSLAAGTASAGTTPTAPHEQAAPEREVFRAGMAGLTTRYDLRIAGVISESLATGAAYRISANARQFNSDRKVSVSILLRAAELTVQNGYSKFLLFDLDAWETADQGAPDLSSAWNLSYLGLDRPRKDVVVVFVDDDAPEASTALSAQKIIAEYAPRAAF